ncbi:MAG: hypothetical protein ABIH21_05760 [Patescibacteria group bacterium]
MPTVFVIKSELDDGLVIKTTNNLAKDLKPYQKIIKTKTFQFNEWSLLCSLEFSDKQTASDMMSFLHTGSGFDFIINHLARNPLSLLKQVRSMFPKSLPFYVIGGLAVDGYLGKLSRMHNDLDLLCWRKDIPKAKATLGKLGFKQIKEYFMPDDPKQLRYFEPKDDNPIITFAVIDKLPENNFEMSLGKNLHESCPQQYLKKNNAQINDITFNSVSIECLDYFNKLNAGSLKKIKTNDPKLYKLLGPKIKNIKHDRKILNQLLRSKVQ